MSKQRASLHEEKRLVTEGVFQRTHEFSSTLKVESTYNDLSVITTIFSNTSEFVISGFDCIQTACLEWPSDVDSPFSLCTS